jgi:hypothetical protein
MINAKESWLKMEYLLYRLGVDTVNADGMMRRILYVSFIDACERHTGMSNPFYINGKAVDYHEF